MKPPDWRALTKSLAARRGLLLLLAVTAAPFFPGAVQVLRHGVPEVLVTFFYLAVPIYQLFHQRGPALNLFVLLTNFAAATALVLTARRLRGDLFALVVALLLAVYETVGAPFPLSGEWNPMTPVLPLALLLFLSVRLGTGEVGPLPAMAFVASAIVQTHVGFSPSVLYLVAIGALFCFRQLYVGGAAAARDARLDHPRVEILAHDQWPPAAALVLSLYKHGFGVSVANEWVFMFGTQLKSDAGAHPALIVADDATAAGLGARPDCRLIATAEGTSVFVRPAGIP